MGKYARDFEPSNPFCVWGIRPNCVFFWGGGVGQICTGFRTFEIPLFCGGFRPNFFVFGKFARDFEPSNSLFLWGDLGPFLFVCFCGFRSLTVV